MPGQYPSQSSNPLGQVIQYQHDPRFGLPTAEFYPNGTGRGWYYDSLARLTLQAHFDGSSTRVVHSLCINTPAGYCPDTILGVKPYLRTTAGQYNAENAVIGAETRQYFDAANRLIRTQTQVPTGPTTFGWNTQDIQYDAWGRVAQQSNVYLMDASGLNPVQQPQYTTRHYDILNRLVREDIQDPQATNTQNQQNGRYIRTVQYQGLTTRFTNTRRHTTVHTHNVAGQLIQITDPVSGTLSHQYNAQGKPTQMNAAGQITTHTYDNRGRKTSTTDPNHGTQQYRYDVLDQPRLHSNGDGQLTHTTYDTLGRPTQRQEADLISTWTYDTLSSACPAWANMPQWVIGQMTQASTSTGYQRIQCYDRFARPTAQRTTMDGRTFWSGTYYESYSSRIVYTVYPGRGQPNQDISPQSPTATVVRHHHSPMGLIGQSLQSHAGTLSGSTTAPTWLWQLHSREGNGSGTLERIQLGNGLVEHRYQDAHQRPWWHLVGTASTVNNPGGSAPSTPNATDYLDAQRYQFDSESNLSQRQWRDYSTPNSTTANPYTERQETLGYDSLNRLLNVDMRLPAGQGAGTGATTTFTYAANGNLQRRSTISYDAKGLTQGVNNLAYTYANVARPQQLTSLASNIIGATHGLTSPTYATDNKGNITAITGASGSSAANIALAWTSFNMVSSLTQGNNSSQFYYGPEHQRVKQVAQIQGQATGGLTAAVTGSSTTNPTTSPATSPGTATHTLTTWYLDQFELDHHSGTQQTISKLYIAGRIILSDAGTSTGPRIQYLHKDHLGSVTAISAGQGNTSSTGASIAPGTITEHYSYSVWGQRRNPDGSAYTANQGHLLGATDRGYTGHEHLDHLGLVHMNGRIYDPSIGRFISADPFVGEPYNLQNHHRYAYVNNNPLSYTDPSGYFIKKLLKNDLVRMAVTIAVAHITAGLVNPALITAWGSGAVVAVNVGTGLASGFVAGFVGSGGDVKAGLQSGFTAALFAYAGTFGGTGPEASWSAARLTAHAAAGCVSSAVGGGDGFELNRR